MKITHFRGLELRSRYNFLSDVIGEYDEKMTDPVRLRGERECRVQRERHQFGRGMSPKMKTDAFERKASCRPTKGAGFGEESPRRGRLHGLSRHEHVSWKPISGQRQGSSKELQRASVIREQSRVPVATSICNGLSASGETARGDG